MAPARRRSGQACAWTGMNSRTHERGRGPVERLDRASDHERCSETDAHALTGGERRRRQRRRRRRRWHGRTRRGLQRRRRAVAVGWGRRQRWGWWLRRRRGWRIPDAHCDIVVTAVPRLLAEFVAPAPAQGRCLRLATADAGRATVRAEAAAAVLLTRTPRVAEAAARRLLEADSRALSGRR